MCDLNFTVAVCPIRKAGQSCEAQFAEDFSEPRRYHYDKKIKRKTDQPDRDQRNDIKGTGPCDENLAVESHGPEGQLRGQLGSVSRLYT